MAARCASCSYPLSVSDSVSCYECLSYFHIDCAQLVGFPNYDLSSDPNRNTFHCQTCKILPLPQQSISFSDSDSDDECTMPSRQLDYHLEGQPDFAKDLNEVKGTVQDLSELCKDMFREINELKSINLTLRCCVENLRHDGEQRDTLLSQLKKRIEALEGKGSANVFKSIDSADALVDRISIEKEEEAERYSTPDPEYSRLQEIDNLEQGNFHIYRNQITDENTNVSHSKLDSYSILKEKESLSERIIPQEYNQSENAIDIPAINSTEHIESIGSHFDKEIGHNNNDEEVQFAEEEIMATTISKDNTENVASGSVKDWDWKGNKAVQIKDSGDANEISAEEDEEEEHEVCNSEYTETEAWEVLDEDLKTVKSTKHDVVEVSHSVKDVEDSEEYYDESEKEIEDKKVTWADEVEKYNEDEEIGSGEEAEEIVETSDETQHSQAIFGSSDYFQAEESEEHNEEAVEGAEKTSLKDEEGVEASKIEVDIDAVEGGAEVEEGKPRLEGDAAVVEGAVPEGEQAEGGQSPEDQGEVQPSELSEAAEPPPPPPPEHTPDDLWEYLKETVTGERPATVEEFVQTLIGTLEHVPEEYLKPVIDYNIKRANSPSVTDGEHIEATNEEHQLEGETPSLEQSAATGEENPQQNGEVVLVEGDQTTALPEGEAPVPVGDALPSEESAAHTTDFPEEPSEGFSPLEAPA